MAEHVTKTSVPKSVTELEQSGCVICAQDMVFQMNVLELVGLAVEKPMIFECDNRGAIDLANNWKAGGWTHHVDVHQNWLRKQQEHGVIMVCWISGVENNANMHSKNLGGPDF